MTDDSKIYAEINEFRLRKQMGVSALARWIGVNHHVVRRTLAGQSEPHDYHRQAFIQFYHDNIVPLYNDNVAKH